MHLSAKMCEGCGRVVPRFGLPSEGKFRWCAACAKGHAGAVNVANGRMCEDCQRKRPGFGDPADRRKRWCAACAKSHEGAVGIYPKSVLDKRAAGKNEGRGRGRPRKKPPQEEIEVVEEDFNGRTYLVCHRTKMIYESGGDGGPAVVGRWARKRVDGGWVEGPAALLAVVRPSGARPRSRSATGGPRSSRKGAPGAAGRTTRRRRRRRHR